MKKKTLLKELKAAGWSLKREGGNHEVWAKGEATIIVPRHTEIGEGLAKKILKDAKRL